MNDIAAIKARRAAAKADCDGLTINPDQYKRTVVDSDGLWVADCYSPEIAVHIAAAPADIDALLAHIERLQQLWSGASKDIQYLQHDGATWKGLFEDMRQKCDTARAKLAAAKEEVAAQAADLAYLRSYVDALERYVPEAARRVAAGEARQQGEAV